MDDNASRSKITSTSNNLLAIASARNTCYVAFQQIAANGTEPWTTTYRAATSQQFSNNLLAIASARNTCYVAFQQIVGNGIEPLLTRFTYFSCVITIGKVKLPIFEIVTFMQFHCFKRLNRYGHIVAFNGNS